MTEDPLATPPGADHLPDQSLPPRARRGLTRGQALALILVAVVAKLAFFAWLDRPWGCDCGRIWALPGDPQLNSRVMLDPYTLMHLVSGAALVQLLMRLRPSWTTWTLLAAVFASGALWEIAENLPVSIRLFNYDAGDPLAYQGDSRLNSLADTAAAAIGALLALRLPFVAVALATLAVEVLLWVWIDDSFILATVRALAGFA
ncbi:DUF2585 family protein [Paracoccus sp. (in: a-proteobacteria)]|uniref:DUF2585 family protein n=1 Tax=Paracoccus sp. TaxID=267 RepID=UPI00396C3CB4